MKYALCITLLSLCLSGSVDGQNMTWVDSLQTELDNAVNDSIRVFFLRKLAWYYLADDVQRADPYIDDLLDIASRKENEMLSAIAQNYKGIQRRRLGEYQMALENFENALAFYNTDTAYELHRTGPLFNMAIIYKDIGELDRALGMQYQILEIQIKRDAKRNVAETYNAIGNIYKDLQEYGKSLEMYDYSITMAEQHQFDREWSTATQNKANVYLLLKKYNQALEYARTSLMLDSAHDDRVGIAFSLETIANIYSALGNHDEAIAHAREAYTINGTLHRPGDAAVNALVLSDAYYENNDLTESRYWVEIALKEAIEIGDLETEIDGYLLKAKILESVHRYEGANEARKKAAFLRDSLFTTDKLRLAQEYESKYKLAEKESKIKALALQNALNIQKMKSEKKVRWFLWILSAILLFAMVLLYRFFYFRLLSKNLQAEKAGLAHSMEKNELKLQASQAMLLGQERERKRIARDLHDSLGGLLSTIKYQFSSGSIEQNPSKRTSDKTAALIDEACNELRRISHDMTPIVLDELGLNAAFEDLCEKTQHAHLRVIFTPLADLSSWDNDKQMMLYRIIQELFQNVLKHAQASKMILQISEHGSQYIIQVEDDGMGMPERIEMKGMGLENIRTRLEALHGQMEIDSQPGSGTTVILTIPK